MASSAGTAEPVAGSSLLQLPSSPGAPHSRSTLRRRSVSGNAGLRLGPCRGLLGVIGQPNRRVVERLEMKMPGSREARRACWRRPGFERDDRPRQPLDERPELVGLDAPVDPEDGGLPLVERLRQCPRLRRLEGPDADPEVVSRDADGHRAVSRQHPTDARLRGAHRLGHVRMIGWIGRPGPAGDRQRPYRLQHQGAALDHRVRHSPNSRADGWGNRGKYGAPRPGGPVPTRCRPCSSGAGRGQVKPIGARQAAAHPGIGPRSGPLGLRSDNEARVVFAHQSAGAPQSSSGSAGRRATRAPDSHGALRDSAGPVDPGLARSTIW